MSSRRWWFLLAVFSIEDFALTAIGLSTLETARELNPLPAAAFGHSLEIAFFVKLAVVGLTLGVVKLLEDARFERPMARLLAGWCVLLLGVNLFSLVQLARAGVFG